MFTKKVVLAIILIGVVGLIIYFNSLKEGFWSLPMTSKVPPNTYLQTEMEDLTQVQLSTEEIPPIIYDRHIHASRSSRLRSQGDPIRGDLQILPVPQISHVSGNTADLQQGALNIIG